MPVQRCKIAQLESGTMAIRQLVTVEDLWEMPEEPGVRYELVEGELVEVPTPNVTHNLIALLVYRLIYGISQQHDLGLVFADSMGYLLRRHPDLLRVPDVSFISWARIPGRQLPEGIWTVAPDLAVEVVSPNDRADDVLEKVYEYLDAGTRFVWVLWPRRRTVMVYEADRDIRVLGPDDFLDGGNVLPDFRVRVADLFAVT
jgi:Uma2 family endonuclease